MQEQHRRGIGADAEQAGMAEADLAGIADHDVEPEDQDRIDRDHQEEVDVVAAGDHVREGRQERDEQHGAQRTDGPAEAGGGRRRRGRGRREGGVRHRLRLS